MRYGNIFCHIFSYFYIFFWILSNVFFIPYIVYPNIIRPYYSDFFILFQET